MGPSLAGSRCWFWLLTIDYPESSVHWCSKYKSKAWRRLWLLRRGLFWLFFWSYQALGHVASFQLALKAGNLFRSIESSYLPLVYSLGRIQSWWIVNIQGKRPNTILICPGTENLFLFCSQYNLQRPWSLQDFFGRNPWISARLLAQLYCGVAYIKAIAGYPIYAKIKLQIEFCLVF